MPKYTHEHLLTFLKICTSYNCVPLPWVLSQPYKLQYAAAQRYRVWFYSLDHKVSCFSNSLNFFSFILFLIILFFNIFIFYTCIHMYVMSSHVSLLSLISKMVSPVVLLHTWTLSKIYWKGHLDDILSDSQEKQQTAFYHFCPFQFHLLAG